MYSEDIDKLIGARLRLRRTILGMSQKTVADAAGITFQQIQKYENGSNSMNAVRLAQFSKFLGVKIDYFFYEIEQSIENVSTDAIAQETVNNSNRDLLEWMRNFQKMGNTPIRKKISELAHTIADEYGKRTR